MAEIKEIIELPEGITATATDNTVVVKGPEGEVARTLCDPKIKVSASGNKIEVTANKNTRRERRMIHTFKAHMKNAMKGVQEPYIYKLKICSGHFPMNVSVQGEQLIIKNFLGEKSPRTLKLKKDVDVKINGDIIEIKCCDKERAGQQASDIEYLTHKRNKDLRIFQDGIYMIEKAGEEV